MPAENLDYGPECIIPIGETGATVRCPTFDDEPECSYWIADEWAEEPGLVMGAIMGAMKACYDG